MKKLMPTVLAAVSMAVLGAVVVPVVLSVAPAAHALDNGLGRTPQLGWNNWNSFGCNVNESLVRQTADAMVSSGMAAAGYTYVNIDDCWSEWTRDSSGNLVASRTKFPSGMKALADYVHGKGLKLGIYSSAGTTTCAGFPASLGNEQRDALSVAKIENTPIMTAAALVTTPADLVMSAGSSCAACAEASAGKRGRVPAAWEGQTARASWFARA